MDGNCALIEKKHIARDNEGHLKKKIGTTGHWNRSCKFRQSNENRKDSSQEPSLKKYLEDVATSVNDSLDRGEFVIVEGTQGTLLSLYFGEYPYVTSKDVSASGICSDVGIGPKRVDEVVVVFKAYLTRVDRARGR